MSYYPHKSRNGAPNKSQDEQGQIVSSSDNELEEFQEGQLEDNQINQDDQIYDSGSSDNKQRIEEQKKKRQDFWKTINQPKPQNEEVPFNLYQSALQAASRTNKKMLMLRKKNQKRIEQLENMRMVQQPYLVSSNTHYRSSINQYPLITIDDTGKKYLHPNTSLRVQECRLDQFIQKNITEEGTSNYLNQVVKFENFAYQHRKKRRQNFE